MRIVVGLRHLSSCFKSDGRVQGIPWHQAVEILAIHAACAGQEALNVGYDDRDDGSMEGFWIQFCLEETMNDTNAVDFISV